ncbi:MAG: hypothetical protein FWH03_01115 [Firmicutes bacterium]|nr:hypothetical protein [Bacillota bacterium]
MVKTNRMIRLTASDIAPQSGTYAVYAADGLLIGSITLDKGGVFPPAANELCHFVLDANSIEF